MPREVLLDVWRKSGEKPRHVNMRVEWPDGDAWKNDIKSKVFMLSYQDADGDASGGTAIGRYSTKLEAQIRADEFLGAKQSKAWAAET